MILIITNYDINYIFLEIIFPATVPGGIYTDLSKAHIIPNNFNENNDVTNRWVGNQSVTYTKGFYGNYFRFFSIRTLICLYKCSDFK